MTDKIKPLVTSEEVKEAVAKKYGHLRWYALINHSAGGDLCREDGERIYIDDLEDEALELMHILSHNRALEEAAEGIESEADKDWTLSLKLPTP